MDDSELSTQSFILKIWLEESSREADGAIWRGYVTHVQTGKRRYIRSLEEIVTFILPFLEQMGVAVPRRWRLERWLRERGRWRRKAK